MDNEMTIQTSGNSDVMIPLSSIEIDTIGEILNISMGSAATAVSTLLGRQVNITTPTVSVVKSTELKLDNFEPAIGIEIEYVEGLSGNNLFVMKLRDIKSIVSLLLSGMDDSDEDVLDEIHISAVSEIMNQMMGASSTALSSFLGKNINISTPRQFDINNKMTEIGSDLEQPNIVSVKFMLEVEGLLNSEFVTIMKVDFTKELVKSALSIGDSQDIPLNNVKKETVIEQPVKNVQVSPEEKMKKEQKMSNASQAGKIHPISVKPVKLQSFDDYMPQELEEEDDNFDLILGVPLDVSVEIGRTKMAVKNVLEIRQGSIVELDRQAGDPVDVIVNGQLIAKGDVVIIDDNFGVRITEILSKRELSRKVE